MLKNFWYAIEFSEEVTTTPKRLTILGQELVLYRDSAGKPVVMSDLCVHRGGALSDGFVEGDCIRCPYHGWKFKQDGACVEIPANPPDRAIPKKARVDSYPAVDKYNWVWAFLGDLPEAERPLIPELPHFDNSELRRITGIYEWPVHFARALENGIDFSHGAWVHGGSFGNRDEPEIEDYSVDYISDLAASATISFKPQPVKGLWRRLYAKEKVQPHIKVTNTWWMPNVTLLEVRLPFGFQRLFNAHVPINENKTITKWQLLRDFFKSPLADRDAARRVIKIFDEDNPFVVAQRPELLPYDLAAELHVKSDAIQVAFRKTRAKYFDMGYGIDMHKIRSEYGNYQAVVIPSPARREVPELANAWVMKEVPAVGHEEPAENKLRRPGEIKRSEQRQST
ncbi:Rieske 2Fe-2S domain-containing protein [Candidatus Leptofilum sp.]|uniref:aromatic ring-hydroxylating dioxygenase subunit alpha n=1 Tax=Candidatus Leptofilum sp. TaxID=3241576 RepID=UPI003B5961DA